MLAVRPAQGIAYSAARQVSTVALHPISAFYRPCAVGKPSV